MNEDKKHDNIVGKAPQGDILVRVVAMPENTNIHGDIFGGWILSQMDLAGSILARKRAQRRTVTVAVEQMAFLCPVAVGDLVTCYGAVHRVGRTSVSIELEAWVHRTLTEDDHRVTHGVFKYVAIDEHGKPVPVGP